MANKNNSASYDVKLAFTADTAQARQQLINLQNELTKLANFKSTDTLTHGLNKELTEASIQANQLKNSLEKATDINTGKLNLTAFSNELTKNGKSIDDYRKALVALGPSGEEAFLQLTQSIITADAALTTGNKKLNDFKKTLSNTIRWQISSNMMHGFIGGIETAYNYAKDLDRSLTDIKIVTESSSQSMADFAQKANKAAQALSTTTNNYAQASLIYYQQGLSSKEVEDRTAVTIKMANAAGESASKVSDQLTAVWNNFYDGSKSLEYYADVMTKLGAYTASSTDEISEGIQKFASVANTIGLSYEYATSALATLTAKTRESANTVGNSLKTLFARIQGLTLGETLEDGTNLNKYSKALEKVGINIKDQQGELKDMNTILDEMMDKWDNLSRAEQVALAQTVGGVRQYTQLVNLMENKDYFKELVGVAENSTGSLETQAEIYADSWEGARKRVQAAAEGIYDSLIDENFFKTVDDVTATTLNGINAIITGLGGIKGVVSSLGALVFNVYRKEISTSLSSFGNMLYNMTPQGQKAVEDRRQEALASEKKMFESFYTNPAEDRTADDIARINKYQTIYEFSQKIYNVSEKLTEEEKKQAAQHLDIINSLGQEAIKYGEIYEKANNAVEENRLKLFQTIRAKENGNLFTDVDEERFFTAQNQAIAASVYRKQASRAGAFGYNADKDDLIFYLDHLEKSTENFLKANNNLVGAEGFQNYRLTDNAQVLKIIQNLKTEINSLDKDGSLNNVIDKINLLITGDNRIKNKFNGQAGIKELIKTGFIDNNNKNHYFAGVRNLARNQEESYNQDFTNRFEKVAETFKLRPQEIEAVYNSMTKLSQAEYDSAMAAGNVSRANQVMGEWLDKIYQKTTSTSEAMVAFAGVCMNLASFSNQIKGIFDTISNPNTTALEKTVSILTSIGMLFPQFINLQKNLQSIGNSKALQKIKDYFASSLDTQETARNTAEELKNAEAKRQATRASKSKTQALNQEAAAEGADATATKSQGLLSNLSGATSLAIGLGSVIAILTLINQLFEAHKNKLSETAQESQEYLETLKSEIDTNNELINSYEETLKTYQKTGEGKSELQEIGTKLCDSLDIENSALLIQQGRYEELAKKIKEANQAKLNGSIQSAEQAINDNFSAGILQNSYTKYNSTQGTYKIYSGNKNKFTKDFETELLADNPNLIGWDNYTSISNSNDFVNWYEKAQNVQQATLEKAGKEGIKTENISYLKKLNEFLADNKEFYENTKALLDSENSLILDNAWFGSKSEDVNSLKDYTNFLKEFKAETTGLNSDDSDGVINSYLFGKEGLGDYALQYSALEEWLKNANITSAITPEDIINNFSDQDIEILLKLRTEATGVISGNDWISSFQNLIKLSQKIADSKPIEFNISIAKTAKEKLKKEMDEDDWTKYFKDVNIPWGQKGWVTQSGFQSMTDNQRQQYLSQKQIEENQTNYELIQNKDAWVANQQSIYDELIANNDAKIKDLKKPTEDDIQKAQNIIDNDKKRQINQRTLEIATENYNQILKELGLEDQNDIDKTLNTRQDKIDPRLKKAYNSMLSAQEAVNKDNQDLINAQDTISLSETYDELIADAVKYGEQLDSERDNIEDSYNAIIQSFENSRSQMLSSVNLQDLNIGDTITADAYSTLESFGIHVEDYFSEMDDGTYKLIAKAQELNKILGVASIENAYNAANNFVSSIYKSQGLELPENMQIPRDTFSTMANSIIDKGIPSNWSNEYKESWIKAAGLNVEEYKDKLDEGVVEAAKHYQELINNGDYQIDVTVLNSDSMLDLNKNAKAAGIDTTDKRYTDAMVNMASEAGIEYDATVTAVIDAQSKYDEAISNYGENSELAKKATEDLSKAQDNLAKSIQKVQFYEATKDLANYMKTLKSTKDPIEKAQTTSKVAETISKAFGKTVNSDFVLNKDNQGLIQKLLYGTQKQKNEAAYRIDLQIDNTNFTNQLKSAVNNASSEAGKDISQSFADQFSEGIKNSEGEIIQLEDSITAGLTDGKIQSSMDAVQASINALNGFTIDGKIDMNNEGALSALQGLSSALGGINGEAAPLAGLLNSILQTSMTIDASQLSSLTFYLQRLYKALQGDEVALDQFATGYMSTYLTNAGIDIIGTGPDQNEYTDITTKGPSGGGGGSSSKKSASDIGKEIQDKRIAVSEKKRERLETLRDGANPEDAQKYIKEEIDLLEEEQQLLEQQIKSWKTLLKTKVQEFNAKHPELEITLDDKGEIANASELWGKVWAEYEKNMQDGMSGEELNEWFTKISNDINGPMGIQENIDENVAAIAQKEKEQAELELESITKAIDWKVKQIDFQIKRLNYYQEKLLKQAHGNKQTIEAMLEGFAYQEQEMLQLFDKGATLRSGIDQLNSAKAQYPDYAQMFDEQILDYQSDLIDVNEAILDLRNDIEDLVQNVMDLALDEIDKQIERLDTYTSMLDHLNNIIDLSGRSMLDMGLKTQIGATKVQTMIGKMTTLKGQMDGLVKAQKEAEAALADRRADGDESSVKFWENQVEVIKQEVEKASDEFLGSWEETLEAAQDLFEMRVEMAVNTLSNALSPFETLEQFQDKYEKAKTINDQYLDDAERLYELSKLNRQLNLQMKDTDDLLAQEKLKEIQKEINDLQADGVQMSQYDLEYLQKKYDLQLAEIALMEQQNSKTSMRLVRDAAGNWTYAYDADEEKIEDATQKYEDAVHELGQLSKDYINDVSEQLIQNQIDFKEALQDLDKNSADYSNQLLSLQEYYVERQRYLLDELNKGVVNSGLTFHDTLYGQMTDLYDYNDAYMQFVNNSNITISELQTNYKDWQKVVETAMNVAGTSWDNFGTDMGGTLDSLEEHIQKLCDEIEELVNVLMGYISQSIGMVLDWEQKYSKRTDQELAKNESYINGNFSGGGGYYSQDVDMRTDFTRLLERWNAGERNLSNYDGSKTYNNVEDIYADLAAKLDAAQQGEKIKYEGSGEDFSDKDQASTLNKFIKGYNSQGGRYSPYSYPNTYSNKIVDKASNYLGTKYTYGGKDASTGLDCSGLVYKALNDAGVSVPVLTAEGYKQMAKPVSQANAKPGDLVFFGANGVSDHVGIYMGNGQMINATGTKTQITNIDTKKAGLIGYGRIGNSNNNPYIDEFIKRYNGAASGAYTGDWGPGQGLGIDNGKIIKVHPKELILNKSDTKNILRAVDIVRDMNNWVDDQIKRMNQQSQSVISNLMTDVIPSTYNNQPIQQEVKIEANFPGVTDHYEIEEALSNLSNDAAQYISANKNR